MTEISKTEQNREAVLTNRERMRAPGVRPTQIRVPDMDCPSFRAQAHIQSQAAVACFHAHEDQSFIDAVSNQDIE